MKTFFAPADLRDESVQTETRTETHKAPRSDYRAARFIGYFISAVGWASLGIVILLAGGLLKDSGPMVIIAAAALGLACLFIVAAGEIVRAVADTADNSRRILHELQRKQ